MKLFLKELQETEAASQAFKFISSHGVMKRYVAAIDGLLLRSIIPSNKRVDNVNLFSNLGDDDLVDIELEMVYG